MCGGPGRGIQRSLEPRGPQAGAEPCVSARTWQELWPWGRERWEQGNAWEVRGRGQCEARSLPEQETREEVGRTRELGQEKLADYLPFKLPASSVGSPSSGLEGTTLAKNSPFFLFLILY